MHDWTLLDISFDWAGGVAELRVLDEYSSERLVRFRGLREIYADRREHWGPSSSINEDSWMDSDGADVVSLKIEMQSGGVINISAESCEIDGVGCFPSVNEVKRVVTSSNGNT